MSNIQSKNHSKIWTKHFILLLLISFFISVTFNMLMPAVPLYTKHIGGSNSDIGMVTSIFTLSAVLTRPWFGNLLDSKGRRMILITGVIILSISTLAYSAAATVAILLFIRFLHGIGFSAQSTAAGTILSDIVPSARLGEGMSYSGIAATLATAVGPACGLFLIHNYSYNTFFSICFALVVIGMLCTVPLNYEKSKNSFAAALSDIETETSISSDDNVNKRKGVFVEKTALIPSLVLFFTALTLPSIFTFITSYAEFKGIKEIGLFFTVYSMAFLIARPVTGRLSDRYGASMVILPGMLFMFLSLTVLAFSSSVFLFMIAAVLYGLGFSSVQPTLNIVTLTLCPQTRRGAANATFFSFMDIGVGLGAIVWGIVAENIGFLYIYLGSAICAAVSLALYTVLLHGKLMYKHNVSVQEL